MLHCYFVEMLYILFMHYQCLQFCINLYFMRIICFKSLKSVSSLLHYVNIVYNRIQCVSMYL